MEVNGIFGLNPETGEWYTIDNSDFIKGIEKAKYIFHHNENNLLVSYKSENNSWTRCYDLSENKKIFEAKIFTENIHLFDTETEERI